MFSHATRGANKAISTMNPLLRSSLNHIKPGLAIIYEKRSFSTSNDKQVNYTHLSPISSNQNGKSWKSELETKRSRYRKGSLDNFDLSDKETVFQTTSRDVDLIKEDCFSNIILSSSEGMKLHYGDFGIMPSSKSTPTDLLKHELLIPSDSSGVLRIRHHTPFMIEAFNIETSFALPIASIPTIIQEYDKIKESGVFKISAPITAEMARHLNIKIQEKIFFDPNKEKFYEETTSVLNKPNEYTNSSSTFMNFQRNKPGVDNSTEMHYHPGNRKLIIFTLDKEAGVSLNFCGIAEDPADRKDTESFLKFPENSMIELDFPVYTHHKFHGDFVCLSLHTQEGPNIIEAVKSGTLTAGFLESATVFSGKNAPQTWHVSLPEVPPNQKKPSRER